MQLVVASGYIWNTSYFLHFLWGKYSLYEWKLVRNQGEIWKINLQTLVITFNSVFLYTDGIKKYLSFQMKYILGIQYTWT